MARPSLTPGAGFFQRSLKQAAGAVEGAMRPGRSGSNVQGRDAVRVGLLALGIGACSAILAPALLRRAGRADGAELLYVAFGALMALAGLSFLPYGLAGLREEARRRRALASHPDEPWLADHPWRREGARCEGAADAARWLWTATFLAAFLAVLSSFVLLPAPPGPFRASAATVLGLLGLSVPAAAGRAVHLLARRVRHGRSELRFLGFPFFLGGTLEAELARRAGAPHLARLEATLRCVRERYVRRGFTRRKDLLLEREVLHEQTISVEAAPGARRHPIRFQLPDEPGLATVLAESPPRYWEVEVRSAVPGIDLGATFLVPVYAGWQWDRRAGSLAAAAPRKER
jgi:hypothetical protein